MTPDSTTTRTDRLRTVLDETFPELSDPDTLELNDPDRLALPYGTLIEYDDSLARDYLDKPGAMNDYVQDAVGELTGSTARPRVVLTNLPDAVSGLPDHIDPTADAGTYQSVTGEITKATDTYSRLLTAAFDCEACGSSIRHPQSSDITARDFDEPSKCPDCDGSGPFNHDPNRSTFVNAQKLRVATPPEQAGTGSNHHLDVYVTRDLADQVTIGDRVTISGVIRLVQKRKGNRRTGQFEPYMDGWHIEIEETDALDPEVSEEERAQIEHYASGAEGDPLELAASSLAPKLKDDETLAQIKKMCILAMVGGARVEYPTGDADRGEFHILMLGDPGTGKSKVLDRIEQLAWRSVGISGSGATKAGTTAAAVQDDFGDGDWTLHAGAFVKANEGVVCVDELDDMDGDVRAAMLEPMSKQSIHINKAAINTRLSTRVATIAAGNPLHGRFDPYEPTAEQFDIEHNLLSRFDLIYTLTDRPDEERDGEITDHILATRDAAKRMGRGELDTDADAAGTITPPIEPDLLGKWIAVAKRNPAPVWSSDEIPQNLGAAFNELRGANGYDENTPVPVTFRKLEGIARIAEAAAKFEFSDEITERHAQIATEAVGASIRDFGRDEDGTLDADISERGQSKSQRDRRTELKTLVVELQEEHDGGAPIDDVIQVMSDRGHDESKIEGDITKLKNQGELYEPSTGIVRST